MYVCVRVLCICVLRFCVFVFCMSCNCVDEMYVGYTDICNSCIVLLSPLLEGNQLVAKSGSGSQVVNKKRFHIKGCSIIIRN